MKSFISIFDTLPVHGLADPGLVGQGNTLQCPAFERFEAGAVYVVADVFLAAGGVGVDVCLHIVVGVQNDPDDAVLVGPLDEILAQAGILLAGSAQKGQTVVFLRTSRPGSVGTIDDALTAADAFLCIPDGAIVLQFECAHGLFLTLLDTGPAADAAVGVQLGLGHAHDAEVVEPHLAAVVGADPIADAGGDIPGTCGRVLMLIS